MPPLTSSTLFFETASFSEPRALQFIEVGWLVSSRHLPASAAHAPSAGTADRATGFSASAEDPDSGPRACVARTHQLCYLPNSGPLHPPPSCVPGVWALGTHRSLRSHPASPFTHSEHHLPWVSLSSDLGPKLSPLVPNFQKGSLGESLPPPLLYDEEGQGPLYSVCPRCQGLWHVPP